MAAVEAHVDPEGKPRLEAQVHEPEGRMIEIEIEVTALARLNFDFDMLGLGIAHHLKGHAGFDAIENGNQSIGDFIAGGNVPGQVLLAGLAGGNVNKGPARLFRQGPGLVFNCLSGALDQLAEILDQNVAGVQIRLHHLRAI